MSRLAGSAVPGHTAGGVEVVGYHD
ncbi:MAG: hypothetical protein JWR85_952, partial [Marmoricola sp.]|nr:hypothetical protein [Marmoricola sp.]